jgi:ribosome-associated protein
MTKAESKRKPDEHHDAALPREITRAVAAAHDKKAADVVVLDLRKSDAFTDFFVLCSGQNTRQVNAIVDAIEAALREIDVKANHVEGREHAEWVLLDYFDFVVHVFAPDTRAFYGLERLWGSAERIDMSPGS